MIASCRGTDTLWPTRLSVNSPNVEYQPSFVVCSLVSLLLLTSTRCIGLPLITNITDSDADMIPYFPPSFVNPRLARPIVIVIAPSPSHRIALRPSPFHRRPRPSNTSPPIAPITFEPPGLAPTFKALCPVVPLSRASFLVLDSRLASISTIPIRYDNPSFTFKIRNTRVFPRERLPSLSPSLLPFLSSPFDLLDSITSDLVSKPMTTSNATYYTVLYGPRPTV